MLLLHPVGLDLTFFDPMVADLKDRFEILRADMRGHGGSPAKPDEPTLRSYVDDIHQLLTQLDWVPTAVVGFSFGGMLAQTLAITYPDDVNALVITACASTLTEDARRSIADRGVRALREGMSAVVEPTMQRWFSDAFLATPASEVVRKRLQTNDLSGWIRAWHAIACVETAPRLGSIAAPTLCLAAEADRSTPTQVVRNIADAIPGAQFQILADAPHMVFIERPHEVAMIIGGFLASPLGSHTPA